MKYVTPALLLIIAVALIILIIRINQIRKEIVPVIAKVEEFQIPSIFT